MVGNRTGVAVNGVATQTRSYDGGGQVVGWAYDDAGQLTDDGTRQYTWDPLGQLASVTQGGVTTLYAYTGDGDLLGWYDGTDAATYLLDTAGGLTERFGAVNMPGGGSVTSSWYSRGRCAGRGTGCRSGSWLRARSAARPRTAPRTPQRPLG